MKNLTNFVVGAFLALVAFLSACNNDNDPGPGNATNPTIAFVAGTQYTSTNQAIAGDIEFRTKINATAAQGQLLTRFQVMVSYDSSNTISKLDTILNAQTFDYVFKHTTRNIAGTEKWTFQVTDSQNKIASESYTLTTSETTPPITIEFAQGIDLVSSNQTIQTNTPLQISAVIQSNISGQPIQNVRVRYGNNGGPLVQLPGQDSTVNTENVVYNFSATTLGTAGTETYEFIATDGIRTTSKLITITTASVAGSISTYSSVFLGAQDNPTVGSFFDAHTGTVFNLVTATQIQSTIDFLFVYSPLIGPTLAAPSDNIFGTSASQIQFGIHNWTVRNATQFKVLGPTGASTFSDAVSGSHLEAAFENSFSNSASRITWVENGDFIAFKTWDGKYGLMRTYFMTVGSNGSIRLDIKVQN